jgi:predicted RNase H-like nuclease (RuvC/YqgF family)
LTREIQHKNSDIMIYEEQIRQMEETIAKLETSVSIHSGDLEAMQSEIKKLVSMKIHQT